MWKSDGKIINESEYTTRVLYVQCQFQVCSFGVYSRTKIDEKPYTREDTADTARYKSRITAAFCNLLLSYLAEIGHARLPYLM